MPKALKEEYVPDWWKTWRGRGQSQQDSAALPTNFPVDIIAVQGLASTYEWTWTKELADGSKVMWLRDLLPADLPDARIMSFEYDSQWLNDPSLVDLKHCGDRLLESVLWDRTHKGSKQMCPIMARRPIILLGHSYGGLVIKQALVTAANANSNDPRYEDYQAFITAITGVIFLGTPHNGSAFAAAGIVQANFRSAFGHAVNADILQPLVVGSTLKDLANLESSFQYMLEYEDRVSELSSKYFYETKPLRLGPFETKVVVEELSACFGSRSRKDEVPLVANHMEMNKFGSRDESNYIRLKNCLSSVHGSAKRIVEARLGKYQYNSKVPGGNVMEIRRWLSPENTRNDVYERRQADRVDGTCQWAEELPAIRSWLDPKTASHSSEGRGVWVSGKAGSGKSVLAVYLFDRLFEALSKQNWSATDMSRCSGSSESIECQHYSITTNKAVLYFPIFKSSTSASTIRTLIHQLLTFQPTRSELQQIMGEEKENCHGDECTSKRGMAILIRLLRFFPLTYIIIDGLDECDNPKELVALFQGIDNLLSVRLLFLARQDNELLHTASTLFYKIQWQSVDISHHNGSDIESFIRTEVSALAQTNTAISNKVDYVIEKISIYARSMFQWVNLVVYALNYARTDEDILKTIERFPRELNEAYADTFRRLSQAPAFDLNEAVLVLKLLSAAYRSLKWEELAMAVLLQKELGKVRHFNAQTLQNCIDAAIRTTQSLTGPSYFSFLGPLIEIRSTAGVNEDSTESGAFPSILGRPETTVLICHHSLSQWIEGSDASVNRRSPEWNDFHFTRADAHKPLAVLSLAMLSSSSMLSSFLQDFYYSHKSAPLLNYSGEYVFAHLRAVGSSATMSCLKPSEQQQNNAEHNLLPSLARSFLENSITVSAGVCAALSSSLNQVRMSGVKHLPKVVAIRSLKTALLPASRNIASVKTTLMVLFKVINELQQEQSAVVAQHEELTGINTTSGSLSSMLDSQAALQILSIVKQSGQSSSFSNWRIQRYRVQQIKLLCKTARNMRRLAILLAVDPVRAWIYAQVGNTGVNPLPALAHAAEAIDTYLATSLLAPEVFSHYDMANQFSAQTGHPYYGLITASRHELQLREYNGFDSAFYRDNIMQHYRISKWDWTTARLLIAAMEMNPASPNQMNAFLKWWVGEHGLYSLESMESISAFTMVEGVPFQNSRFSGRFVSVKDRITAVTQVWAVWLVKYIFHIYPPLENVFTSARIWIVLIAEGLRPTITALLSNWNDLLIALFFYLLRWRYAPWIFGNVRANPFADLKGILTDPKDYTPAAYSFTSGWIPMIFFLLQECVFLIWLGEDIMNAYAPKTSLSYEPSNLERRTSFRLNWSHKDPFAAIRKLGNALSSHGFYWFSTFRRLIVIEKMFLYSSYWLFDLISSAAAAVTSKLWSMEKAMTYGVQLALFAHVRSAGLHVGFKWLIRIYVWYCLDSWYRETSLAGFSYHIIYLPATRLLSKVFHGAIQTYINHRDAVLRVLDTGLRILDSFEAFIGQALGQLEFRTLVYSTTLGLCMLGFFVWWIASDPLGLESAAQACSKAERLAKKATNLEDPVGFLKWHGANGTDPLNTFAFTGQLADLDAEL